MTTPSLTLCAALLPGGSLLFERCPAPAPLSPQRIAVEQELFALFQSAPPRALLALGMVAPAVQLHPSVEFWRTLSSRFCHQLLLTPRIEELREKLQIDLEESEARAFVQRAPELIGGELLSVPLVGQLWAALHEAFATLVRSSTEAVEPLLQSLLPQHSFTPDRIHFHLVENRRDDEAPFAFLATYSEKVDTVESAARTTPVPQRHLPLRAALARYEHDTTTLLTLLGAVQKAAKESPLIAQLLDSRELFFPLRFSPRDAYTFLSEVPLYEQAGILCRIPRWWSGSPPRIKAALSIAPSAKAKLDANSMLQLVPQLHIDGEAISEQEVRAILANHEGLALIKGKWVAVDPQALQQQLELLAQAQKISRGTKVSLSEAMRLLIGLQKPKLDKSTPWEGELVAGTRLSELFDTLASPTLIRSVKPPRQLQGTLRPYQQQGFGWLCFLYQLRLGALLADDMGLGKTIQVLSLLLHCKHAVKPTPGPSLLVVPASLIDNWRSEAVRFAPSLRILIAHSAYSSPDELAAAQQHPAHYDVCITTYAMSKKLSWISGVDWNMLILDEAQAIKNPASLQTKAIKQIPAAHRVAMTGTPVENNLGDLWSLFDFINPGVLGTVSGFKRYIKEVTALPQGYAQLRSVIRPYILRRLKTDTAIIQDLPQKVLFKAWATLSRSQVVLYQRLAGELYEAAQTPQGIQRSGLILAYLLKFKQLCNHPDQLSGGADFDPAQSGKFARLAEICELIRDKRERVLVFTQFREMVEPLNRFLHTLFGHPGVTLHGGTGIAKRKEAVERFQSEREYVPYFVLSLKAGGVGLNLTAANHVVHFDRWWNPAVERQAEDRAFRIGQKRAVMVHQFICKGTIEERIDALISEKQQLAESIVGSDTQQLLTQMSTEQLREMVTLTLTGASG